MWHTGSPSKWWPSSLEAGCTRMNRASVCAPVLLQVQTEAASLMNVPLSQARCHHMAPPVKALALEHLSSVKPFCILGKRMAATGNDFLLGPQPRARWGLWELC